MTETKKAYIVGIIDGEESIMLQKIHKNEFPSPCVSIASTTLELLDYIKITYGKGKITKKKNYDLEHHRDCYSYILRRNDAIDFLNKIYPYLIIDSKKIRANIILEKYKSLTPRNGRYSAELLESKKLFYEEFMGVK